MRFALADLTSYALPATGLTHLTCKPTLRLALAARPVFFVRRPATAPSALPAFHWQLLYPASDVWQPAAPSYPLPRRLVETETGDFTGGVASVCPWHEAEWESWGGMEEVVALLKGLGVAYEGEDVREGGPGAESG